MNYDQVRNMMKELSETQDAVSCGLRQVALLGNDIWGFNKDKKETACKVSHEFSLVQAFLLSDAA